MKFSPRIASTFPARSRGVVQVLRGALVQQVVDQRALARARDAGDADELAERDLDVDVLQIVLARALDADRVPRARPSALRQRHLAPPAQVRARHRTFARHDRLDRPLRDDAPARLARARPHIDDVVGRAHHRLVVLDDQHGVAEVAQPLQRLDQPLVVDGVEADARLVADVQHAHQARTDLRRQPDALRFAAGQRARAAVERQVVEANVEHERQPRADLLQDLPRDQLLALAQRRIVAREPLHPLDRLAHVHRRHALDVEAGNRDGEDLRPEAGALAGAARHRRHVALDLAADVVGVGLLVAALEVRNDALERRVPLVRVAAARGVLQRDRVLIAVEDQVDVLLLHLLHRHVEAEAVLLRDRLQHPHVPGVRRRARATTARSRPLRPRRRGPG